MRKEMQRRHARVCLLVAAAVLALPAAGLAEPTADTIAVNVDQAKLVRLPGKVATIVVGNPLIADVTLQPGEVRWLDAQIHSGENIGTTPTHVLFVELKDAASLNTSESQFSPAD